MNYIDYIVIAVVLVGFLLGYKDGLVRKVIGVLGLIIGVILAFEFSEPVGKFLAPIFDNEVYLAKIVGGILIFLLIILVASIIKRVVHPVDKVNRFINQILGGFSGAVQMFFFISGFFLFLNIFNLPSDTDRQNSLTYYKVYSVIPTTIDMIIGDKSQASTFIKDFIEKTDSIDLEEIEIDSTIIQ